MATFPLPLISVITPSLNAESTIKDTLKSVACVAGCLANQGASLQHIVIDGGSVDRTESIVAAHKQNISSSLLETYSCCWLNRVDLGIYAAMNTGLENASGYYTHILNADDFILNPDLYASLLLSIYHQKKSILLGAIRYFERPSMRLGPVWCCAKLPNEPSLWRSQLLRGLHYPHPGFIALTDLYRKTSFDTRFRFSADYKLMQIILLQNGAHGRVNVCSEPLVAMAVGGASGTWLGVCLGALEISRINRELGIRASLVKRYWKKFLMRVLG